MSGLSNFQRNFIEHIQTGSPCLWVQTDEQIYLDQLLAGCAAELVFRLREWNLSDGWVDFKNKQPFQRQDAIPSLANDLQSLKDEDLDGCLFVIQNVQLALDQNNAAVARLQQLLHRIQRVYPGSAAIILVDKRLEMPNEIKALTTQLSLPLPSAEDISGLLDELAQQGKLEIPQEMRGAICSACTGLTQQQISQLARTAIRRHGAMNDEALKYITHEKAAIIAKDGVLEIVKVTETIGDVGGLGNLKKWLKDKARLFTERDKAKAAGIAPPKGTLIVGMPGCGKSLTAKAAASIFGLPLVRLDIGSLLGKYVGESEHNMRRALSLAEALSPCVLWIDELEKAFAGMGGEGGSEVATRLLGYFLTWMQEKTETVFVVATANDISKLPTELLRKGRFDEIFYVDFPNMAERTAILRIQLRRIKEKISDADLKQLAERCENFTGADIQNAVNTALQAAFLQGETESGMLPRLKSAIESTVPLYETMRDKIKSLKDKFKELQLQPATGDEEEEVAQLLGDTEQDEIRQENPQLFKAAEEGNANAQFSLGWMYDSFGEQLDSSSLYEYRLRSGGETINAKRAMYWYRKAASQGHSHAQYNLGVMYAISENDDPFEKMKKLRSMLSGEHEPIEEAKQSSQAEYWLRKAADLGDADAQWMLSEMYQKGDGVEEDDEQSEYWYRKSANQEHPLARMELCGGSDYDRDDLYWYRLRKAADSGCAQAQYELGEKYQVGHGRDLVQAAYWYRKAAELGYARAQLDLARMYEHGDGVEEDLTQAVYWYRKAADQGDEDAQYMTGLAYGGGDGGLAQDGEQAEYWFRKAAAQGHYEAKEELACLCARKMAMEDPSLKDLPEDHPAQKLLYWLHKAGDAGNVFAQFQLGLLYASEGEGEPGQDLSQAKHWFRKAAEQGDEDAKKELQKIETASD